MPPLTPALILAPDCGKQTDPEQRALCDALMRRLRERLHTGDGVQLHVYDPTRRTRARLFKPRQRVIPVTDSSLHARGYIVALDMPAVHSSAHPMNNFRTLTAYYTVLQAQAFSADADLRPLGSVLLRSQLINQIDPMSLTDLMRITADRLITGLTEHRCQDHPMVYCPDSFKLQQPTPDPRKQFILEAGTATDATHD